MMAFIVRQTKGAQIDRQTGHLGAVHLLLGPERMDSFVRHLSAELEDARAISEAAISLEERGRR
jgi:hypothetical protein